MYRSIIIILMGLSIFVGQYAAAKENTFWVKSIGDRMDIIQKGDLSGNILLEELKETPHLYAIGPVAGLQGEVTIYNSRLSVSTVVEDKPAVSEAFKGEAIFLIYASAPEWMTITTEETIHGLVALEAFVKEQAIMHNLQTEQPFPFRIEGIADEMTYHIIFKSDDLPHNKQEHHKAKRKFDVKDQAVEIIGFWVDKNRVGKLTHPGKRTHLHMQTPNNSTSGHIDALKLTKGSVLYLPVR